MPRPPHRPPTAGAESDDSGSFGGLADVLEPDFERDSEPVTSVRPMPAASVRHPSLRAVAPAPVQDFAFADTVFANDLPDDGPPPPSGPIFVQDPMGNPHCVTPLAFRVPTPSADVGTPTLLGLVHAHARHALRAAVEEMSVLWADTDGMVAPGDASAARQLRRLLALWSVFHWSRADLTRAAMIGLGVFVTAAVIGAATMDLGDGASSASSSEVRARRTLDQHTGRNFGARSKR